MSAEIRFFVGTYTQMITNDFGGCGQGIHSMVLNTSSGEISEKHLFSCTNPSYLTLSPCQQFLYAIREVDQHESPVVMAFEVLPDSSLRLINSQAINGGYPCHIAYYQDWIWVACYGTGNILCYAVDGTGRLLPSHAGVSHQGQSINQERQEGPHAHQIIQHPISNDIYVPDLGIDKVKAYAVESGKVQANETLDLPVTAGGGPRHMTFSPDGKWVFVINELNGVISCFSATSQGYQLISEVPSLPHDFTGQASASAIRIHPNGQYLYAGNRNFEGITLFHITPQGLALKGYIEIGGKTLREFNLSPNGQWLIAAHQDSHDLVVYRLLDDGLVFHKQSEHSLKSPVCILF